MSEKTEKPTPKKLADARKKGDVVKSKEVTSAGVFLCVLAFLGYAGALMTEHVAVLIEQVIAAPFSQSRPDASAMVPIERAVRELLWAVMPLAVLTLGAALVIGMLQVRGVFATDPLIPKFERLNPAEGLKNLVSTKQLFELLKMLLKTLLLGTTIVLVAQAALAPALLMTFAHPADIGLVARTVLLKLFGFAAVTYVVTAAVDYGHQYFEYIKKQRMSKEETRREYRDMEGDPYVRSRRRATMRELAQGTGLKPLSQAKVVIANPTHFAVALYYEKGETDLPIVIAKGTDAAALRIRAIAEQHGIPVLENRPLARRLYDREALEDYIGEEFIDAVAEVFRWLKRLG